MNNEKMNTKNYSIGLDIGTSSVGWAVVNSDNFKVIRKGNKALWGVRLFEEAKTALDEAKGAMTQNQEAVNNYESALGSLDGTVESVVNSIKEEYGIMASDGHYTYDSLKAGIADLNSALDENGERYKSLSETEREASRLTREQLITDCIEKSVQLGKSYDEMKEKLGSAWETMTDEEKKALEEQYNAVKEQKDKETAVFDEQKNTLLGILDEYNVDRNSAQAIQWQNELTKAQENGTQQGEDYINNLAHQLETGKITKTDPRANAIGAGFKSAIESHVANFNVNDSEANRKVDDFNRKTLNDKWATLNIKPAIPGIGAVSTTQLLHSLGFYATGGLPEMGEMFIARESGPELVGRIGRKNAVANNDQIISGVSNGVYNAVKSAMSGINTGGGSYEIHTTVTLDGKQVGKSVIDYHNGIVKQTGKSPLNT